MITHIIAPLFLFVFVGWLLVQLGIFNNDTRKGITLYVFYIAIPALLFNLIANQPIQQFLLWHFIWLMSAALLGPFIIIYLINRHRGAGLAAMQALNVGLINSALIGIPVLLQTIGNQAIAPAALINIICLFITILGITLLELAQPRQDGHHLGQRLLPVLKNPIILSILLGLLFSSANWHISGLAETFLTMIDKTAAPMALLVIGMDLNFKLIGQKWRSIVGITLLRMVIMPVIVIAILTQLDWPTALKYAAAIGVALPTAKATYIYSCAYDVYRQETAANVTLTTLIAMISLPIVMWVCQVLFGG